MTNPLLADQIAYNLRLEQALRSAPTIEEYVALRGSDQIRENLAVIVKAAEEMLKTSQTSVALMSAMDFEAMTSVLRGFMEED